MGPEDKSASSDYNAVGDGFNVPEAITESPLCEGWRCCRSQETWQVYKVITRTRENLFAPRAT